MPEGLSKGLEHRFGNMVIILTMHQVNMQRVRIGEEAQRAWRLLKQARNPMNARSPSRR